ncbi:MAG: hypothetical protein KBG29_06105 [Pseudomonadales bacterium]|nr:hypothetical protein [Pseudomonadales bacterium]MBP9033451.1 hypothetical protein [Pseudomonadales bacterium]
MRQISKVLAVVSMTLAASTPAWAQPIVYPAKGQSPAQQQKDEGECYVWAKQYTGIDPAAVAQQPPAQNSSSVGGGERVGGAARGALGGAAIGAIAGDTGQGAAIGAVAGTMLGGRRARQNAAARDQVAASGTQAQIDSYNRAYGACLEGRGYTVK